MTDIMIPKKSYCTPKPSIISVILLIALSFLKFGDPSPAFAQDAETASTGTIAGTITDLSSGSPLFGGSVNIVGTTNGAMAGEDGVYRIANVAPGTYNLRFSMIGYDTLIKTNIAVSPGRTTELAVELTPAPVEIDAVTVTAKESYFEKDPEAEVSGRTIDTQEIVNAAGAFMDIQRVVQVLPSVTSGSDQMNEIIVRGGNYNENLFVMDGIEIPNPNHFAFQGAGGGPISLLRAEFVRDVSFIAGAFPAKYGDKASSVMDITLRRGNSDRRLYNIDMGMAGVGAMAEGPVGKGTFLASARKSFLDLIISNTGLTAVPHYYNFQTKLTYPIGGKHTLLWNSIYGADSIEIRPDDDSYGGDSDDSNVDQSTDLTVSGFTLKSVLTPTLYGEGVLSYVGNNWHTGVWDIGATKRDPLYNNRSTEREITLKYDLTWLLGDHELSGGVSVKNSRFDHEIFADIDTVFVWDILSADAEQDTILRPFKDYPPWRDNTNVSTYKSAVYGQLRLAPTNRLSLRLGGRYDRIEYTGHGYFSPRLGVRYQMTEGFSLNGAYGVHYQSPSYITLSAHPDNKHLDSYHTDQVVVGTEWLPRPDTRFTAEVYSKRYHDVPVSLSWIDPDPWDNYAGKMENAAKGHSEGIEFYLQRKMSTSYYYILSYSYYRAFFEDPRTGKERPWDFDHRNVFTATFGKRWGMTSRGWYDGMKKTPWYKALAWLLPFGDEVMLSTKWRYAGGRPYTDPTYEQKYHSWVVYPETPMNGKRYPPYHRLDIRLDRRWFFTNWSLVAYIDIMNVYGRSNVWEYSRDEYGKVDIVEQFSTVPVGGFNIEF